MFGYVKHFILSFLSVRPVCRVAEQNKIGLFAETDVGAVMLIRTFNPLLNKLLKTKGAPHAANVGLGVGVYFIGRSVYDGRGIWEGDV